MNSSKVKQILMDIWLERKNQEPGGPAINRPAYPGQNVKLMGILHFPVYTFLINLPILGDSFKKSLNYC